MRAAYCHPHFPQETTGHAALNSGVCSEGAEPTAGPPTKQGRRSGWDPRAPRPDRAGGTPASILIHAGQAQTRNAKVGQPTFTRTAGQATAEGACTGRGRGGWARLWGCSPSVGMLLGLQKKVLEKETIVLREKKSTDL